MIVPMKKVTLLVLEEHQQKALEELRQIGVMQIENQQPASADSSALAEKCEAGKRTLSALEKIQTVSSVRLPDGEDVLKRAAVLLEKEAELTSQLETLSARLKVLSVWGDFDRSALNEIESKGVFVTLCAASEKAFELMTSTPEQQLREISRFGGKVYFVVISLVLPEAGALPEFQLTPEDDPVTMKRQQDDWKAELAAVRKELTELAGNLPAVRARVDELRSQFEFSRAKDALAGYGRICVLKGFVPEPEIDHVRSAAVREGWGILIETPGPEDHTPTLLERSRFAQIIEPLFAFLGIDPGYEELDVSSGVLIFFTVFYAMIVGDAGYGVLFLAGALYCMVKFRNNEKAAVPLRLFLLLSIATIIWGVLTDNFFGYGLPGWLGKLKLPALSTDPDKSANTMCFCFILAVLQLSMGRIWRAIHLGTFRGWAANLGWTVMILANFLLTVRLLVYPGPFPKVTWYLYGVGFLMTALADVNWKNPADLFQYPFSVIGSFSDVLSYIRLFAVGLSGYYIASSFNGMCKGIIEVSPWLIPVAALGLLLGHGLNLALCMMSVLVHGVRLNTLEFSSHVGLSWGGIKYHPFQNHKMEEN